MFLLSMNINSGERLFHISSFFLPEKVQLQKSEDERRALVAVVRGWKKNNKDKKTQKISRYFHPSTS